MNFGARPFLYPVQGYQPLDLRHQQQQLEAAAGAGGQAQQPPLAGARYLAGCLSRLLDVSSPAAELPAAAAGAEAPAADAGGADTPGSASGGEAFAAEQGAAAAAAAAVAAEVGLPGAHLLTAAAPRRSMGSGLLPDADMLAALAAAAKRPSSSKAAAAAAVAPAGVNGMGNSTNSSGPAIGIDDRILLAAVLAEHLGPLCFDAYTVEAVLLPLLDDVAGELGGGFNSGTSISGRGAGAEDMDGAARGDTSSSRAGGDAHGQELGRQRLQQLLELLAVVLESEELDALVATSCQVSMQPCLLPAKRCLPAAAGSSRQAPHI